jgi:hypothetical protein
LGFTYFVQDGDAIKIGSSTNPEARIKTLQTGLHRELKVLAIVPQEIAGEFETHQRFAHHRIRGEWFRAGADLLRFIRHITRQAEKPSLEVITSDGNGPLTLAGLIEQYKADPVSGWSKLRFHTRRNHETLLRRLIEDYGSQQMSAIRRRDIELWYLKWSSNGQKVAMGHAFVAKLRTLVNYGASMIEDEDCVRISLILSKRKFAMGEPRKNFVTAAQADAICAKAHEFGYHSIALAQALQFDLVLRQKDVIGEWVPPAEPGESDVVWRGRKWLRGLRWSEIDSDLILTHTTSKKGKTIVVDLKLAPFAYREILATPDFLKTKDGPIIICEATAKPWEASEFRRKWRMIATAAGVPNDVFNMDSRSGGISEGTDAGIPMEHMRHAATHSDVATTARYSRNSAQKISEVLKQRAAYRQAKDQEAIEMTGLIRAEYRNGRSPDPEEVRRLAEKLTPSSET